MVLIFLNINNILIVNLLNMKLQWNTIIECYLHYIKKFSTHKTTIPTDRKYTVELQNIYYNEGGLIILSRR